MNSIRLLASIGDKILIKLLFSPWNNNRTHLSICTSLKFLMSWLIEQQERIRGCFSPFLLCLYMQGWMWAEKILFERMLPQTGNNFSFLGFSCCAVFSNFILEKGCSHLETFRQLCFDSSVKLTAWKAWKRGFFTSTSLLVCLYFLNSKYIVRTQSAGRSPWH